MVGLLLEGVVVKVGRVSLRLLALRKVTVGVGYMYPMLWN